LSKLETTEQLLFTTKNYLPSDIVVTTSDCVYRTGFISVDEQINQMREATRLTATTCGTRFRTEVGDILHLTQTAAKLIE
jgi:hypothetical protein